MSICRKCLLIVITSVSTLFGQTIRTANLTFSTIDFPGAVATNVLGINSSGDMVGIFSGVSLPDHGFLYSGGAYTTIDYPTGWTTTTSGINDSGVIVGQSTNQSLSVTLGFRYDGATFTPIQVPGAGATEAYGINNTGIIVGGYSTSVGNQAFALIGSRFKDVTPPPGGYSLVYATGINSLGEIVGWDDSANISGFSYKNGKFQTITVPGSIWTEVWGVNDRGVVVGSYEKCSPCAFHAFALSNGRYFSIDYPGADDTFGFGINKSGQIVGAYTLSNTTHGFVTSLISPDKSF
jgi:hypothetical protein